MIILDILIDNNADLSKCKLILLRNLCEICISIECFYLCSYLLVAVSKLANLEYEL